VHRAIEPAVLSTVETVFKTLVHVEQNDLDFEILGNSDIYIDLDIKFYVRGILVSRKDQGRTLI